MSEQLLFRLILKYLFCFSSFWWMIGFVSNIVVLIVSLPIVVEQSAAVSNPRYDSSIDLLFSIDFFL